MAARMPWLSVGSQIAADLESSSSSASLLHSIYGSQSSQLLLSGHSSHGLSEAAPHGKKTHIRPKSSPVSRVQRRSPSSSLVQHDGEVVLRQTPLHRIQVDIGSSTEAEDFPVGPGSAQLISVPVARLQGPPSPTAPRMRRPPSAPPTRSQRCAGTPASRPRRPPSAPVTRPQRPPSAPVFRPRSRPPSAPAERPRRLSSGILIQQRSSRPKTALGISVSN